MSPLGQNVKIAKAHSVMWSDVMNHRMQWFIESLLARELPCLATAVPHVDDRDFGDKLPIGVWIMIIYGGSVREAKSYSDLDREYLAKCQVQKLPNISLGISHRCKSRPTLSRYSANYSRQRSQFSVFFTCHQSGHSSPLCISPTSRSFASPAPASAT